MKQDVDLDVEGSLIDDWEIGFVGPVNLTKEGETAFASILNNEVAVCGDHAIIEIADMMQNRIALKLFKYAAGFCTIETYDKLFRIEMTTAQAIRKAMTQFKKDLPDADIRTIKLLEGSGNGNEGVWENLTIGIEYAVNGDYTRSDKFPYQVTVFAHE